MAGPNWVLGIDFGTSNTAAAHVSPISGSVEAVALSHDRTTMSSSVFVDTPENISVGPVATDRAESNPAAFIPSPKRTVGTGSVTVNGYTIPASTPIAAVLKSVIARATSTHGGTAPSELVLTHPEGWAPREIQILLDAAAQLGLDASKVTTVSEPRAAAHYYSRANVLAPGTKIAVFDFGGGTLDTAVLEANAQGTFDIVAARGDNGLGGKNLDAAVRRWVFDQLGSRDPDLLDFVRNRAPLDVRYALDDSLRRAKELLSEAPSATITVSGDGRSEKFQITRDEFEELIAPDLERAVTLARDTLRDAHITDSSQLEALYLTGGSSRIPIVHERLRPLGPIATLDDPKTVVAMGALAAAAPVVRGLFPTPAATSAPASAPAPSPSPRTSAPEPGYAPHQPNTAPYGSAAPWAAGSSSPWSSPSSPQEQTADVTRPYLRESPSASPSSSSSSPERSRGSSRTKWLAGAGAGAVVVALIAAGLIVTGGGDDPASVVATDNTAATSDGTSDAPAVGSGNSSTGTPTTKAGVVSALPPALRSEINPDECTLSGETTSGSLQLQCPIAAGSSLTTGLTVDDSALIAVSVDVGDAKKRVIGIRQGYQTNTAVPENVTVENTARTAAAAIDGPNGQKYDIYYGNSATGVMVAFYEASSVDNAKTFLRRAGLIS